MEQLTTEVGILEVVIDPECRQLLESAVTHAFAMIAQYQPSFDLKLLKGLLPKDANSDLEGSMQEEVEAFMKTFAPEKEGKAAPSGADKNADEGDE